MMFITGDRGLSLVYYNAVNEGTRYFRGHPELESMVIGISGGVDSAITAALANKVVKELEREGRKIKLYGYSLPIISNHEDELKRAALVGTAFCNTFIEYNMDNAFERLIHSIDGMLTPKDHKVRLGNIKARLRMIYLYDKANRYKGLVLSTDNYTEYLLGFWTLHGDVGDLGFVQELWKTEVYALANWMVANQLDSRGMEAVLQCIKATPTDGLGVSNSDLDQLFPNWKEYTDSAQQAYRMVDKCLIQYIYKVPYVQGETTVHTIGEVINRYENTHYKRENPFNIQRNRLV